MSDEVVKVGVGLLILKDGKVLWSKRKGKESPHAVRLGFFNTPRGTTLILALWPSGNRANHKP